jgi:nitroimidazol reductase NimA-like FMN-containing flavoprotein (pyridoxamine 5'-phosphate oxidase superfamily)
MTQAEIWEFVSDGHTGILTTLRRDGVPISTPLWYAVVDHLIYFTGRGKKLKRIAHDSRASFLVESGKRWAELKAVQFTGKVEILDDVPEQLSQRIEAVLARYSVYRTDRSRMPTDTRKTYDESPTKVVRFTPDERILNWDNTKLGLL